MTLPPVLRPPGLKTGGLYALIFAALGAHLPFWPLWLAEWGLTASEIGAYTAAGVVVRIGAGFAIPMLADAIGARRLVMAAIAGGGALVFLAHPLIEDRAILLIATLATGLVYPGMIPISDALGSVAARDHGFSYARARAMGSVAFLLSNLAVGWLIGRFGVDVALGWIVLCLALSVWLSLVHPGGGRNAAVARVRFGDVGWLLSRRTFLVFILAIGCAQGSHAVFYAYGSVHWAALGLGEGLIGALWAFGVGVEVVLMMTFGGWLVQRIGPVMAITLSGVAGVLRWGWMALDPTGGVLWLLQAIHALTFALGHLGAIAFVAAAVEDRLGATAQGVFGAAFGGFVTAIAMGLAAVLYDDLGGTTYLIAAILSGCGALAGLILGRLWTGGLIRD
ncbi:MAG: MFS transporter [Rubricella sp.]